MEVLNGINLKLYLINKKFEIFYSNELNLKDL